MQLYITEDGNLRLHCCENLKTYAFGVDSQLSVLNSLSDSTYLYRSKSVKNINAILIGYELTINQMLKIKIVVQILTQIICC